MRLCSSSFKRLGVVRQTHYVCMQAITADPSDHVFYSNRSAAYLSKGDAAAALEDAEKCIGIKSDWGKGFGRKGAALHALGHYDEAVQAYEAGLAVDPSNGALKDGLKEAKDAEERAGASAGDPFGPSMFARLAQNPRFIPYLADETFRAKLSALQNDKQAMQSALLSLLQGQGMAIQGMPGMPASSAAPQDPRMLEVLSFLMGIDMDKGGPRDDPMEGVPQSRQVPQARQAPAPAPAPVKKVPAPLETHEPEVVDDGLTPEERAAKASRKAQAVKVKEAGNEAYKGKNFTQAMDLYKQAQELDPEDITYSLNIAAVHMEEGRHDEAVSVCLAAVEKGREVRAPYSSIGKAYLRAGNAHYKAGRLEQAVDCYESSLLEHRTEEATKKAKECKAEIKKRAEQAYLDPAKAAEAKERGNEAFKAGDFVKALNEYSEAIKRDPEQAVYWNNRASAKSKLMDFQGALADAEHSLKLDPKYSKAQVRKGNCHVGLQEYHKALDAFKAALALEPDNAEAKDGLRRVVAKIGSGGSGDKASEQERQARALADPEIQAILRDPMVNSAIEDMQVCTGPGMRALTSWYTSCSLPRHTSSPSLLQKSPAAFNRISRDPNIGPKIEKLIAAGILRTA